MVACSMPPFSPGRGGTRTWIMRPAGAPSTGAWLIPKEASGHVGGNKSVDTLGEFLLWGYYRSHSMGPLGWTKGPHSKKLVVKYIPISRTFHLPKLKLCLLKHQLPTPVPSPWPHHVLSVSGSMDVTPLGTPHTLNHTGFVLLCLGLVTEHHILEVYPHNSRCRSPSFSRLRRIPFYAWTTCCLPMHPSILSSWGPSINPGDHLQVICTFSNAPATPPRLWTMLRPHHYYHQSLKNVRIIPGNV